MNDKYDTIDCRLDLIKQIQEAGKEVLRLKGHDIAFKGKITQRGYYRKKDKKKCEDAVDCSSTH